MADVRVLVIRAPGTNCDLETVHAWGLVGARAQSVHVNTLVDQPKLLTEAQILTVAGGFCYGDDISAGKILASRLELFLSDSLREFVAAGKLVLGICNGFQVLVKTGLLPGAAMSDGAVTLGFNRSGRYEDRWVHLKRGAGKCLFVDDDGLMQLPIAHAEGRIVVKDAGTLDKLDAGGHIAFRYVDEHGQCGAYPINPNESAGSVAGLTDDTGQVLGLMPHPERNIHITNHPCWTRLSRDRRPDGLRLFETAIARLR